MEQVLQTIPGYETMFSTQRRIYAVGVTNEKSLNTKSPQAVLQNLDAWITQSFKALAALHTRGLAHGGIDVGSLRITEAGTLRLGGLEGVFEAVNGPSRCELFDAHNIIYPPERLFWCGAKEGLSFQTMFTALEEENQGFDRIPNMLPALSYSRGTLRDVYDTVVASKDMDWTKGDVWMLGNTLMSAYMEVLAWPYVLSSEFYRTRHEQLMDMFEHMLAADPRRRWDAGKLLETWMPNSAPATDAESPLPSESETPSEPAPVPTHDEAGPSNSSLPLQRRPRLFLNVSRDPSGRNKTRRTTRS